MACKSSINVFTAMACNEINVIPVGEIQFFFYLEISVFDRVSMEYIMIEVLFMAAERHDIAEILRQGWC